MIGFVETPARDVEPGDRVLFCYSSGLVCLREVEKVHEHGPSHTRLRLVPGLSIRTQNELVREHDGIMLVAREHGVGALNGQFTITSGHGLVEGTE